MLHSCKVTILDTSYEVSFMILFRGLVRAGATGAWAPTEILQRVQGTRPDRGATKELKVPPKLNW